jgi:hypothetical protein
VSSRARSRIVSELAVRAVVAVLLLAFNELFGVGPNPRGDIELRTLGILTLLLSRLRFRP